MVKQQSADAARGEAGPSATSQPALVLAAAKQAPMKADEAKVAAVARPPARNEPAQPGKADVPSPKPARAWVVELKANVQVTVDIESLNGDDICDKMADQVVLILDNSSLYRISHSGADRITRLPPKRLSLPLGPDRRPAWLVERLARIMLDGVSDVRVILKPEWEVQIFDTVLAKIGNDPDFSKTRYLVSARFETSGSAGQIVFVVGDVTRRPLDVGQPSASLAAGQERIP
jgi:hypothetical protein